MTKRFCDRCEKEIVGASWIAELYREDFLFQKVYRSKCELCKECAEEVKIFIGKGEKKDETMA